MISMAEQETRTRLSDLVTDRRARLHISLVTLAERCIDPVTGERDLVKVGWLHRIERHQPVKPPELPQLRALAAGLEVPLRDVQDAAGEQFLGITTVDLDSTSGRLRALVNRAGDLSPADLERLIVIAESFTHNRGGTPGSSE